MNLIPFASVLVLSLFLTSCDLFDTVSGESRQASKVERVAVADLTPEDIENRCISKTYIFRDNGDDNLYGLGCIEGKGIQIKTQAEGELVATTTSAGENLRLEKEDEEGRVQETEVIPNVINKFYKVQYKILDNEENNKLPKWLKGLISKDFDFYGLKDKEYRILFKTVGNYLVLYKATKNVDDLPFTERSALPIDEKGEYRADQEGYYKVPFMGYEVQYCKRNLEVDDTTGNQRRFSELDCNYSKADNTEFIRFNLNTGKSYGYVFKKNVFPVSYFIGSEWFYTEGDVEKADSVFHHQSSGSSFVKLSTERENVIELVDASSGTQEGNKKRGELFSVEWKEYERHCSDARCAFEDDIRDFESFGERENPQKNTYSKRPYIKIAFPEEGTVSNIIMTEDYFSYVIAQTNEEGRQVKRKVSLLRAEKVNQKGFHVKRWFNDDVERKFPILSSNPEVEVNSGSEEEVNRDHFRQIHFNTSAPHTVIRWHFSNYTVKNDADRKPNTADDRDGDLYRGLGKKAVETFNRAFAIITEEYCTSLGKEKNCKTIKVELADEGDKDLGDLRYNILNLVNVKVLQNNNGSIVFGHAPSFERQDTGQIIGTTTNVFIHNILKQHAQKIESYIRYEIFRKDRHSKEGGEREDLNQKDGNSLSNNQEHVVPEILKSKIENRCEGVNQFIEDKKPLAEDGTLKPEDSLKDEELLEVCSREVSKEAVLQLILHEMGHSFGLGHNFKASLDRENYYKNVEEMRAYFPDSDPDLLDLSKSSSVMDYLPVISPSMTVLGKYDLAMLRYLYLDQVETKDYKGYNENVMKPSLMSLNTPLDVEDQTALNEETLSEIKNYQACWDTLHSEIVVPSIKPPMIFLIFTGVYGVDKGDFLCIKGDYGSNPTEIVQNYIKTFKRSLNNRYRYARSSVFFDVKLMKKIQSFYNKWIEVRSKYLQNKGLLGKQFVAFGDEEGIKEYERVLKEGLTLEEGLTKDEEYALYYGVREPIAGFMMDYLLLKTMKCQVHVGSSSFFLDLEDIKSKMDGKDLYVEDCQSQDVQDFLETEGLVYAKHQRGLENFGNYAVDDHDTWDVVSINRIFKTIFDDIKEVNHLMYPDPKVVLGKKDEINLYRFLLEPNFLQSFMNRLGSGLGLKNEADVFYGDVDHILLGLIEIQKFASSHRLHDDTQLKNLNSFSFDSLALGAGEGSFYQMFVVPLKDGVASKIVFENKPFLYEAYLSAVEKGIVKTGENDEENYEVFEGYFMETYKAKILNKREEFNKIFIPIEKDGLLSHIFEVYNSNHKRWEELNTKGDDDLTKLEQIEKENLNTINKFIFMYILLISEIK